VSGTTTGTGDGRYRYVLTRTWSPADQGITWVMLNPSTATAEEDDPTIRRCIGFSQMWGYGGMTIVNLFAYRATDPAELFRVDDPTGPMNHHHIERQIQRTSLVVAAWGAGHNASFGGIAVDDPISVESFCHRAGVPLKCLGRTRSGAPRHPLYVKGTTPLEPFGPFEEAK